MISYICKKITFVCCVGVEIALFEFGLQIANRSLWEFIEPIVTLIRLL